MSQQQVAPSSTQQKIEKEDDSKTNINKQAFILSSQIEDLKSYVLNIAEKQMDTTLRIIRRWLNS